MGLMLAVVAVGVRLIYLSGSGGDPSFLEPLVDSRTYHDLAAGLADGGPFTVKFLWQAVFYPVYLSGVYSAFGISVMAAILFQVFLGGATCYLTFRLGLRMFGSAAAFAAGLICAFYGPLIFFESRLMATGWTAFWMVSLALLWVRVDRNSTGKSFLVLGVVGALAILTRPTFIPIILAVVPCLVWMLRRQGLSWIAVAGKSGLILAGTILVLGPVSILLERETGHAGIIPPSGGINLYIGNNENYQQTINVRPGLAWDDMMAEPLRQGCGPGPWAGQPYFIQQAAEFGRNNPGGQAALWGQKFFQLISSRELPRNVDVYLHRQWSGFLGFLIFKWGAWGFPWGLVFPVALVGLTGSLRKISIPFILVLFLYGASLVLVFVSARYRAPMVPLVAVLAGQGTVFLVRKIREKDFRALLKFGSILAVGLVLTILPGPFVQEEVDLEPELYFGVGFNRFQQEDWPLAVRYLERSVGLDPNQAAPRNYLGVSLAKMGRLDEACAQFDTAVAIFPEYGEARRNLMRCQRRKAGSPIPK